MTETHATPARTGAAGAGKRFATLRAALALRGWALAPGTAGYTATRWGRDRQLDTITDIEHFARQIGAPL